MEPVAYESEKVTEEELVQPNEVEAEEEKTEFATKLGLPEDLISPVKVKTAEEPIINGVQSLQETSLYAPPLCPPGQEKCNACFPCLKTRLYV